jgi:hypothetical protein
VQSLHWAIETASEHSREKQQQCIVFVDFANAFNAVEGNTLNAQTL